MTDEPPHLDLPEGDERYRLFFEQAGMAMVAVDLDGRIVAWNQGAQRMFGAGPGEVLNTSWTALVPAEEREAADRYFQSCLQDGRSAEFEFSLRDERGRARRLAAIATPIIAGDGRRRGGLACVRDITNRAILQDRLAQQSKMAALGEMAGALSHHFNNILGGVVTSVDFALASGDPDVLTRVMEKTAKALTRATGLTESLLAFAQGDFRDATLCDLNEALLDAIAQAEAKLVGTPIELAVDLRAIPVVEVPRIAMQTVLNNLLDNAIEAMTQGGELSVALDATRTHAVISIGDTGCGLDEESLTRIFEPFYSTKQRDDQRKLGQGLGLAVAHGILKVLRGAVQVTSTLGEGTVFEVRLPLPGVDGDEKG